MSSDAGGSSIVFRSRTSGSDRVRRGFQGRLAADDSQTLIPQRRRQTPARVKEHLVGKIQQHVNPRVVSDRLRSEALRIAHSCRL
jgi:hypothetical protein